MKNAKDIEVWFDTEDEGIVDVDHDYNEQDGDVYYFVPKKPEKQQSLVILEKKIATIIQKN